jgi:restriction system protein
METMARKKVETFLETLFGLLVILPFWGGPLVAGLAYLFLRFIVPTFLGIVPAAGPQSAMAAPVVQLLTQLSIGFAPIAALLVLVSAASAEVKKFLDRKRLDVQTGLESIRQLPWREFELLICESFRREGYRVEHTGRGGPDGGVDVVLGRDGERTLVQCKQWRVQDVGVNLVRELLGVVASEHAQRGIFITSGSYTEAAIDFARNNPLTLVAGEELARMIRSAQSSPESNTLGRRPLPALSEAEAPDAAGKPSTSPKCPRCGCPMVKQTAKRGDNIGSKFWGCSRYPACKGTRPIAGR